MGFIDKLLNIFREEKREEKKEVKDIRRENLDYNENLIDMLVSDHKELIKLFQEMKEQFEKNSDFRKMLQKINDFKLALEIHLMVEDSQLYGYIENMNRDNEMMVAFVKDVQNEMKSIAEEVILFIRKYTDYRMYHENKDSFLKDLNKIGEVLTKRIEMEEKRLYSLYRRV